MATHVAPWFVEYKIEPTVTLLTIVVRAASHPALVRARLQTRPLRTGAAPYVTPPSVDLNSPAFVATSTTSVAPLVSTFTSGMTVDAPSLIPFDHVCPPSVDRRV
jgi:hypothetical protein